MPRRKKNRGGANNNSNRPKNLTINGPWGSKITLPIGRLPITLGADRTLSANRTIYPSMVKLDVPIVALAPLIVTGQSSAVYPLDTNLIRAWATRFGALFDEYAIVGFSGEVRLSNVVNPAGVLFCLIDEKSASPLGPAAANSARLDIAVNNYDTSNHYRINWVARDYLDLEWQDIANNYIPAWLKFYASPSETGTTASTTASILITGTLALCFRGYRQH